MYVEIEAAALIQQVHWNDPNYNEAIDCNATFMWDGVTLQKSAKNDYPDGFYESCTRGNWSQFKFDTVRSLWDFNMTINKDHKDPRSVVLLVLGIPVADQD